MELLAPAGTMENFMAAIMAGADAIYLGGKVFNARASAGNFDKEEMREAVRRAHLLGVPIYVTVNILIGDSEMEALTTYIRDLDEVGVDAVIVQDIAVARIVRQISKRMAIHGSTQMTASNLATVNYLYELGFSRVVLSRELSLDEIAYICKNTKAEIEVFVHGALCISYSGQCLMSSLIGGRSGNRGACAQPCRLPYELLNGKGESILPKEQAYIMSPKDLNYADHMGALMKAGVASFKVEGRMKKPSYVSEVIGAYRNIIDQEGTVTHTDHQRLETGFNRGFSQAYLKQETGRSMMTIAAPNHQGKPIGPCQAQGQQFVVQTAELLQVGDLIKIVSSHGEVAYVTVSETAEMRKGAWYLPGETPALSGTAYLAARKQQDVQRYDIAHCTRKIPVDAYLTGEVGAKVSLTLVTDAGESVTVTHEYMLAVAEKTPTSQETVTKQLGRMGNTFFLLRSVSVPEGSYMWPASVLNALRREAVAALEVQILESYAASQPTPPTTLRPPCGIFGEAEETMEMRAGISVRVDTLEGVQAAVQAGASIIHVSGDRLTRQPYPNDFWREVVAICNQVGVRCVLSTPRVVKAAEEITYQETLARMVEAKPYAIGIHCLGALRWLQDLGYRGRIWGEESLNLFNTDSIVFLAEQGIREVTLSEELTLRQVHGIAKELEKKNVPIYLEGVVQGEQELMITEYCAIAAFAGSGKKKGCTAPCMRDHFALRDRKGAIFPLRTDPYCRMHIMNSCELDMQPYAQELQDKGLTYLRIEARQRDASYITAYVTAYRELLSGMRQPPSKSGGGVTRGHYFKGILG